MPKKKQAPAEPEVSEKSTKPEILAAYRQLLEEKERPQEGSLFPEERAAMKPETKKEIESLNLDSIVMQLSALRVQVGKYIADLEQKMTEQSGRLGALHEAIQEETARLKELHDIEGAAGKLVELREAQAREQAAFEEALVQTRAQWDKEKKDHDLQVREREAQEKKERTREEEDYQYQIKQKRQREKDAFESEMEEKHKAFEEASEAKETKVREREDAVKAQEKELAELRKKMEAFPSQLDAEVRAASMAAEKATEERLKLEKLLLEKDIEREREIYKLTIGSLQEKSKEQEARIKAIEKDLKESVAQSQSVAARAIEGIAGLRHSAVQAAETAKEGPGENRR